MGKLTMNGQVSITMSNCERVYNVYVCVYIYIFILDTLHTRMCVCVYIYIYICTNTHEMFQEVALSKGNSQHSDLVYLGIQK